MNKKFIFVIISLALVMCMSISAVASSLSDTLPNTSQSGWAYSTLSGHMGTKYTTYRFETNAAQNQYGTYLSSGIALWGSNISMTCVTPSSTAVGTIIISNDYHPTHSSYIAVTGDVTVDSNGHRTGYKITIYAPKFSDINTGKKILALAHEVGHAYGLGHVAQTTNIMHASVYDTMDVTAQDVWGMKVVTHEHVHSASTTGTYSICLIDESKHEVICNSCKGIYLQAHTYNLYNMCTRCGYQLI